VNIPVHRNTDSRSCGASTIVSGQSNVFVNNLLASVQGDGNTHGGGALGATVNDGTVFVNNKKLVLKGSNASPDALCPPLGPPHCNPTSVGASGDVFACGGGSGGTIAGSPDENREDPTRQEVYGGQNEYPDPNATEPTPPPNAEESKTQAEFDTSGFTESDLAAIEQLESDPDWIRELEAIEARYPNFSREELYNTIKGESAFNPRALNNNSGASGYFQFIPDSARELGTTTTAVRNSSPAEQLNTYGRYLDRWNYNPDNSGLGIMQAAPAYANRPPNYVLPGSYAIGGRAWQQNPGWRTSPNGPITVQSVNDYYSRQS